MKISFGNFLAQLSDRLGGADVDAITATLALDPKIGSGLLRPGTPYGGTCFPRDTNALQHFAHALQLDAPLVRASDEINSAQYDLIERHVMERAPRCVAILGLAFKPGTPVTTGSPGYEFVRRCIGQSIPVVAFDPIAQARADARKTFGALIACHDTLTDCLREADTVLVCHADSSFAELSSVVAPGCRIIDPWGCVSGSHPGLVRVGRLSVSLEPALDGDL